jgi:glycosyltransferase involved in cell wall biosynthesis
VDELISDGIDVIVVDDGSSGTSAELFNALDSSAIVLHHERNRGKGAALKTAFRYLSEQRISGQVVTLDADGQHRPEDAVKLLELSRLHPEAVILGVRNFRENVPLRSFLGNQITKAVFLVFSGKYVADTQTGLRAFHSDFIPFLLDIEGERYEYETNMLLKCAKANIPFLEVPIATIYTDKGNLSSHFRTIRDSARIYGNIFLFAGSSFLSFLVDYIAFLPLVRLYGLLLSSGAALILANIMARVISAGFNYYLNSTHVFRYRKNRRRTALQYGALACLILLLNTAILYTLSHVFGIDSALAKIMTELLLFIVSFLVQKSLIFGKHRSCGKENNHAG